MRQNRSSEYKKAPDLNDPWPNLANSFRTIFTSVSKLPSDHDLNHISGQIFILLRYRPKSISESRLSSDIRPKYTQLQSVEEELVDRILWLWDSDEIFKFEIDDAVYNRDS